MYLRVVCGNNTYKQYKTLDHFKDMRARLQLVYNIIEAESWFIECVISHTGLGI